VALPVFFFCSCIAQQNLAFSDEFDSQRRGNHRGLCKHPAQFHTTARFTGRNLSLGQFDKKTTGWTRQVVVLAKGWRDKQQQDGVKDYEFSNHSLELLLGSHSKLSEDPDLLYFFPHYREYIQDSPPKERQKRTNVGYIKKGVMLFTP